MSNQPEKYRPSNGTEGDIFQAEWCYQCARFQDPETEEYCPILGATFTLDIENPEYPEEWSYDDQEKPCCTAFLNHGEPVKVRCSRTEDMFGGEHA